MIWLFTKTILASVIAGFLIGYFMGYFNLFMDWICNKQKNNPYKIDDSVYIKIAKDMPFYPFESIKRKFKKWLNQKT